MRSFDGVVNLCVEKSGQTESEILKLIKAKQDALSGLISDEGAAHVIANELKLLTKEEKQMEEENNCTSCGKSVDIKVKEYSEKNLGKILCYNCQKGVKKSIDSQTQTTKSNKESFVVNIQGKDFITYEGILTLAHKKGAFSMNIIDSWVSEDMKTAWCKVRLTNGEISFDGFGSSTPENTGKMTQEHPVEMSHTRAKARALRDYLNIGMVALEELYRG